MVIAIFLLCSSLVLWPMADTNTDGIVVSTAYGDVRGSEMQSRGGRYFAAFRGIPYAKPPVDALRFKAPEDPDCWTHVLDATKDAKMCIQQDYLLSIEPEVEGSEDCLYLNVYSPLSAEELRKSKKEDLLPVMVFIHYGGFFVGSSSSDVLGPEYLMDKDVILVTFNYRLGVLGFLSTYDDAAPGNWGFKDQLAVLKWVQNNIEEFGGDTKRVTLFGQSAGGASVHHHILSPRSKGLFHAAISQSGSALALWAQPQRELSLIAARAHAELVGCNSTIGSVNMVDCLRKVPAAALVESMNLFRFMRSEPLTIYTPTIEFKTKNNPEPFITKDPVDIIRKGEFANIPWIIGITSDEGILRAAPFTRQTDLLNAINEHFDSYFPQMLSLELSVKPYQLPRVWTRIKEFYFSNTEEIDINVPDSVQSVINTLTFKLSLNLDDIANMWRQIRRRYFSNSELAIDVHNPNSASVHGLINIYSDRAFLYPAYQSALVHRHKGHEKVWFYNFDYKGRVTYGDLFAITDNQIPYTWGVSHCDDLLYLFNSQKLFPKNALDSNDLEVSHLMVTLFTNFATYLDPTPATFWDYTGRWDPLPSTDHKEVVQNSDLHFFVVTGYYENNSAEYDILMAAEFVPKRMSFWMDLPLKENIENLT